MRQLNIIVGRDSDQSRFNHPHQISLTSSLTMSGHTEQDSGSLRQRNGDRDSKASLSSSNVVIEPVQLKREVGLLSGVALIAGTMIGSGIFISPKGVLRGTGSIALSLIVWGGCGIISMLGALCYAELGTLITKSGAEYAYILEAFGPIPAYLFSWTSIVVIKTSGVAIICLAFADYVLDPIFDDCGPPEALTKCLAAVAIVAVALVNCFSVKLAAKIQVFFTITKLCALVIIIIGGLVKLGQSGGTDHLSTGFEDTTPNPSKIALAFYSGLWAYDGWNNLNFVTEELQNPQRNLPLAVVIAIPLVSFVYILTNVSYFSVMSKSELLASSAVASLWGDRVLQGAALIIPISVACSTFGAANGSAFTAGRLTFAASREGHLPDVLSYINVRNYTPLPSLVVNTIISLLFIIPGDVETLIDFFSFTAWIFYGCTVAGLLFLRYKMPHAERPYKVPIVIPILFVLCAIYLVIGPIIDEPQIEFLYATIFIFAGLIFYVPFVHFKLTLPGMDGFTIFFQQLAEVAPSSREQMEEW